jgi:hypothetical protein
LPGFPRPAGAVAALWRYPVKSMQGEALDEARLGAAGVVGDRAYAVVEVGTGRVASAKHPRKWGALFACRARFVAPPRAGAPPPAVAVTLPDGERVVSDDRGVHAALSRALGRAVRLVAAAAPGAGPGAVGPGRLRETDRTPPGADAPAAVRDEPLALAAPPGTFFDVAPVHLLATTTLAALAARAPASRVDVRRFRPNVLVRPPAPPPADAPFVENDWIGSLVGPADAGGPAPRAPARLAVIDPTPRCLVTTLGAGDLPADPEVLRTVLRANAAASRTLAPGTRFAGVAGVYAVVTADGWLRRGDALELDPPV